MEVNQKRRAGAYRKRDVTSRARALHETYPLNFAKDRIRT
jgi:hypothetical protein